MKKKLISKYVLSHEIELKVRTLVAICVCYEFLGLWKVWEKVQMTWKKGIWWCQFSMGNAGIANIASARRPTSVRDLGWMLWRRWWLVMVQQGFTQWMENPYSISWTLQLSLSTQWWIQHASSRFTLMVVMAISTAISKDSPYSVVAYLRVRNFGQPQ